LNLSEDIRYIIIRPETKGARGQKPPWQQSCPLKFSELFNLLYLPPLPPTRNYFCPIMVWFRSCGLPIIINKTKRACEWKIFDSISNCYVIS